MFVVPFLIGINHHGADGRTDLMTMTAILSAVVRLRRMTHTSSTVPYSTRSLSQGGRMDRHAGGYTPARTLWMVDQTPRSAGSAVSRAGTLAQVGHHLDVVTHTTCYEW